MSALSVKPAKFYNLKLTRNKKCSEKYGLKYFVKITSIRKSSCNPFTFKSRVNLCIMLCKVKWLRLLNWLPADTHGRVRSPHKQTQLSSRFQ